MQRIRKGDEVVVISGRDKGKRGVVLARIDEQHLTVEGKKAKDIYADINAGQYDDKLAGSL